MCSSQIWPFIFSRCRASKALAIVIPGDLCGPALSECGWGMCVSKQRFANRHPSSECHYSPGVTIYFPALYHSPWGDVERDKERRVYFDGAFLFGAYLPRMGCFLRPTNSWMFVATNSFSLRLTRQNQREWKKKRKRNWLRKGRC